MDWEVKRLKSMVPSYLKGVGTKFTYILYVVVLGTEDRTTSRRLCTAFLFGNGEIGPPCSLHGSAHVHLPKFQVNMGLPVLAMNDPHSEMMDYIYAKS